MKLFMPGKVISGHEKYEEKCSLCHKKFKKALQRPLCMDCHKDVSKDIKENTGFHGLNSKAKNDDCRNCHTDHKGRDFNIVIMDKDMFAHNATDFPLRGSHVDLLCKVCHKAGEKYRAAKGTCITCHRKKDYHKGTLGEKCADCHKETVWRDFSFDHNKTKFKLAGKHERVLCTKYHPEKNYKKTPRECYGCHKVNDVHGGKYATKCQKCHTPKGWKVSVFKHKKTGSIGKVKITNCYACHEANDLHKGGFGRDCKKCHTTEKWKPSIFKHDKTEFELIGKHKKVDCKACHTATGKYEKLKTGCFGCHKQKDKHNGLYGTKCADCHISKDWKDSIFDHQKTDFKLDGKHKEVSCHLCHKKPPFKEETKSACKECHRFDDTHKGRYGAYCAPCHTPEEWKKSVFDHQKTVLPENSKKGFEKCPLCFKERLGKTCNGCHKSDDIHKGKEGDVCEKCHFIDDWNKKVFFDHDTTNLPLIGMHAMVPCEECHLEPTYKGVRQECNSCHQDEDKHKERLGPKCGNCHNPNGFSLWIFDHSKQTDFTLDGAHEGLECLSCHKKPVKDRFTQSKSCVSCHEKESIHPGKYWKNCKECHNTTSFEEVTIKR
ncbi:MAG: cytochrome c3 family protein [Nitrospinota bacterium]